MSGVALMVSLHENSASPQGAGDETIALVGSQIEVAYFATKKRTGNRGDVALYRGCIGHRLVFWVIYWPFMVY